MCLAASNVRSERVMQKKTAGSMRQTVIRKEEKQVQTHAGGDG